MYCFSAEKQRITIIYYNHEAKSIAGERFFPAILMSGKEGVDIWEIFITIKKVGKTIGEILGGSERDEGD